MNWYERALAEIESWDSTLDLDARIKILAVLSPRCRWDKNLRDAQTVCETLDTDELTGVLSNSIAAARDVLMSPDSDLRGRKVNAFYRAIAGDTDSVVIDSHMASVFNVKRVDVDKGWERAESSVRSIAQALKWTPRDAQATIWQHEVETCDC